MAVAAAFSEDSAAPLRSAARPTRRCLAAGELPRMANRDALGYPSPLEVSQEVALGLSAAGASGVVATFAQRCWGGGPARSIITMIGGLRSSICITGRGPGSRWRGG